jgi:hypothetical protein
LARSAEGLDGGGFEEVYCGLLFGEGGEGRSYCCHRL